MPDYPYIYQTGAPRPVEPGGTRLRFFRRRREETAQQQDQDAGKDDHPATEPPWSEVLEQAVADLNAAFRQAGAPFTCSLEEDDAGYTLIVRAEGAAGSTQEIEEVLEPSEFPRWLSRLRARLGVLVDETA